MVHTRQCLASLTQPGVPEIPRATARSSFFVLLSAVPLDSLSIHLSGDIWIAPTLGLVWIKQATFVL